jgi:hypothetical protein
VGLALIGVAAFLVLWRTSLPPEETPEAVVAAVYQHCQAGEYAQTARYYLGGPETDADMRRSVCEKITEARHITGWYQAKQTPTPEGVYIQTQNWLDQATQSYGRTLRWRLVRQGGRWRVAEVV